MSDIDLCPTCGKSLGHEIVHDDRQQVFSFDDKKEPQKKPIPTNVAHAFGSDPYGGNLSVSFDTIV